MADVRILHDVILAFHPQLARFADRLLTAIFLKIGDREYFCANESALEIGMDDSCGFRSRSPLMHRPGADLFFAGGVEGLLSQQGIDSPGQLGQSRFIHAVIGQHLESIRFVQFRELFLDAGANRNRFTAALLSQLTNLLGQRTFTQNIVVTDIHHEHLRFGGDQPQSLEQSR